MYIICIQHIYHSRFAARVVRGMQVCKVSKGGMEVCVHVHVHVRVGVIHTTILLRLEDGSMSVCCVCGEHSKRTWSAYNPEPLSNPAVKLNPGPTLTLRS